MASYWGMTPKQSVLFECERRSPRAVVHDCVAILSGEEPDAEFLRMIGGPSAETVLEGQAGGLTGLLAPRVGSARSVARVGRHRDRGDHWRDDRTVVARA